MNINIMNIHITNAIAEWIGVENFVRTAISRNFATPKVIVSGLYRDDKGAPHRITVHARVSPRNQQPERLLVSTGDDKLYLINYLEADLGQSGRHLDSLPDIDNFPWPPHREPTHP